MCKDAKRKETKEERLRRKLVNVELNPIADFLLSVVLLALSPFIWLFHVFHDKIMFRFLNRCYIYNVSWEDPRMDHRVFHLDENDHIITIASAGCNVLDYIIEGARVTAVDFNLCQIALTELKKVAIIELEFEQFFEIFSNSNMDLLREVYASRLRPRLSAPSADFWDEGVHTIKSFMYSGSSGSMSYVLFRILFPLFGLGFIRKELMKGTPNDELVKMISNYQYSIRSIAWVIDNVLLRGGCCLAGVPERQMNLGLHRPNNIALVIDRVFFRTDLVKDNYFFAGYILGHYKSYCCPRYLEKEHFLTMRKHLLKDKLHLVHGTMLEAIDNSTVPITVASLLDHMDWMTDRMINEEITHLLRKMDHKRGKIYWRTFADDVHSAPLKWLQPDRVAHADDDGSDDRVGMYWTTWIAYLNKLDVAYEVRVDTKQDKGTIANLITGAKMVTFPLWKPFASTGHASGHAKDMESFYKYQKEGYDAFRENLLHARSELMESMPLKKGGGMVWVDVGGGTARNLEFFSSETIRKYFKSITIVDISASLLEVAQRRVELMGLTDIVKVVEHDFTKDTVFKVLPKDGTVDIVTMSYSFTMIPDQKAAIRNSARLVKSNGKIMIADFFQKGNHDDSLPRFSRNMRKLESSFHKLWFSFDHVHLLSDDQLSDFPDNLECIWDSRFRGGVPFIPFLQPYHGVYILEKTK